MSMQAEARALTPQPRVLFAMDSGLGHVTVHLRGLLYRDLFAQNGWDVRFVDVRSAGPAACLTAAEGADIVYLLKIASLDLVCQLRARTPGRIVFDLTDSLWHPVHQAAGWQDLDAILREVDEIYSENEWICAYGRRYKPHVTSLPVSTQVERFDALRTTHVRAPQEPVVLGWVGSAGTVGALAYLAPVLRKLASLHPGLTLRVLGVRERQLPDLGALRTSILPEYDEAMMIREMLSAMDIGLFPPPLDADDYAVRGALKALLYMTAGLPVVCLRAGDPARIIRDGHDGMLCSSETEWESKLDRLIRSAALRRDIGTRGLQTVRAEHSTAHTFGCLQRAFMDTYARSRTETPV